jgi:hypothetical protein
MTDKTSPVLAWVPDACTLPTAQQPLRLAEFDALFTSALERAERRSDRQLRLVMTGSTGLETTVRDLAARESDCCSFFTFTVTAPQPGQVTLDVEVPEGHIDVLDALADRAATMNTNTQ